MPPDLTLAAAALSGQSTVARTYRRGRRRCGHQCGDADTADARVNNPLAREAVQLMSVWGGAGGAGAGAAGYRRLSCTPGLA